MIGSAEVGGQYTVKVYESEKEQLDDDSWRHTRIILSPDSSDVTFEPIVLEGVGDGDVRVLAQLTHAPAGPPANTGSRIRLKPSETSPSACLGRKSRTTNAIIPTRAMSITSEVCFTGLESYRVGVRCRVVLRLQCSSAAQGVDPHVEVVPLRPRGPCR